MGPAQPPATSAHAHAGNSSLHRPASTYDPEQSDNHKTPASSSLSGVVPRVFGEKTSMDSHEMQLGQKRVTSP